MSEKSQGIQKFSSRGKAKVRELKKEKTKAFTPEFIIFFLLLCALSMDHAIFNESFDATGQTWF